mgnify:CR=1 FL=1
MIHKSGGGRLSDAYKITIPHSGKKTRTFSVLFCLHFLYNAYIMNNDHISTQTSWKTKIDSFIPFLLIASGIISSIFFFPFFGVSLDFAKMSLFSLFVIGAVMLWAIARLKEGALIIPRSLPALAMAGIVCATVLSALLSPAVHSSFFGAGYETTTAAATGILAIFFFLAYFFIRTPKQISVLYVGFFAVMLIVGFYEAIRLVGGPSVLSFGIFNNLLQNPIGKWNDLALLYGLSGAISLLALTALSSRGILRVALYTVYGFSLLALFISNFSLAWGLFAFSAIAIAWFIFITKNPAPVLETADAATSSRRFYRRIPFFPLVGAVIAIIFLLPGNNISDMVGGRLGLSNIEVRPSWSATFDIARESAKKDPLFGIGPNRFADSWLLHKPDGVNDTLFWNTEFEQGIGIIPSLPVTVGILGAFLWIFFLLSFARAGIRSVFVPRSETIAGAFLFGSFLGAAYLFLAMTLYVPSAALSILAFLFAGVTLGMIARKDPAYERTYIFAENPRIGFISVLLLVAVLILSAVGAYIFLQRFASAAYTGSGVEALAAGDFARAEEKLARAQSLFPHDSVAQIRTEAAILRMRVALTDTTGDKSALQARFQEALGNAVSMGKEAVAYDETNYQNWIALGRVYEAIVPLQIEGAYENAKAAYEKARALNPKSPAMELILARLEAARGNLDAAREYLGRAIAMKGNYTEAIFALAQLEAEEGNMKEAIEETKRASLIAPNDIGIFFQLGFLRYTARDYAGAVGAFERTVILNSAYANAKYFLGLSYAKLGRIHDAIRQFEDIETLNPGTAEVENILENLRAGKDPFASVVPQNEPPEKRKKPPIDE